MGAVAGGERIDVEVGQLVVADLVQVRGDLVGWTDADEQSGAGVRRFQLDPDRTEIGLGVEGVRTPEVDVQRGGGQGVGIGAEALGSGREVSTVVALVAGPRRDAATGQRRQSQDGEQGADDDECRASPAPGSAPAPGGRDGLVRSVRWSWLLLVRGGLLLGPHARSSGRVG